MAPTHPTHPANRALEQRMDGLAGLPRWALAGVLGVVVGLGGSSASASDPEPPCDVAALTAFGWVGDPRLGVPADIAHRRNATDLGPAASDDLHTAPTDEPDGVILPPRPQATLAEWSIVLPVPLIRQIGDKSNCGPSAAAMAVGSYAGAVSPASLRDLRNAIGEWTWQRFPRRQRKAEGSDAGGTTRTMMMQSLNRFGEQHWTDTRHSWVPEELWAVIRLRRALAERRPLVVLAEAAPLWGIGAAGLHWVVVTGFDAGRVLMHDPADGREAAVPLQTFWRAWRLPERFHAGPGRNGFEGLVADQSLPVPVTVVPKARHLAHEALEQF